MMELGTIVTNPLQFAQIHAKYYILLYTELNSKESKYNKKKIQTYPSGMF